MGGIEMKKAEKILILVFICLLFPTVAFSQSAIEAIRALKKIEAKTQVGVNLRDYTQAVGDAKFEVNLFLESPDAKENPELSESVKRIIDHYSLAVEVWGKKQIITTRTTGSFLKDYLVEDEEIAKKIFVLYPETKRKVFKPEYMRPIILISDILRIIWETASEDLKKAMAEINK
jgi:hypothetical protein